MQFSSFGVREQLKSAVTLAALLGAMSGVQAQSLALYDNFPGTYILPTLWFADDGAQYGGTRTESVRSIVSGQAHMELRTWGDTTNNSGASTSRTGLDSTKSAAITTMQAAFTMRTAAASACSTNASVPSQARARLFGFYFNAGNPRSGSSYNDVYATAQVYRASNSSDPASTMRVSASVGVCTDDSCIGSTQLAAYDLGTVNLGSPTNLRIVWDKPNKRFVFQRDGNAPVYSAYTLSDVQEASFPAKRMEIANVVPHCTGARPSVLTVVDFDNVYTNPVLP